MQFDQWKLVDFDIFSIGVRSFGSDEWKVSFGIDNGLVLNRQAIILATDNPVYWWIYVAPLWEELKLGLTVPFHYHRKFDYWNVCIRSSYFTIRIPIPVWSIFMLNQSQNNYPAYTFGIKHALFSRYIGYNWKLPHLLGFTHFFMLFGLSFSVATFLLIALWCSSHVDWFFWYGRLPFCLSQSSVPGSLRHGFQHSHYKATVWCVDVEELIIWGSQGMLWDCSTYYISWHSILWLQLFPQHYCDITSGIILGMGSADERRRYNVFHWLSPYPERSLHMSIMASQITSDWTVCSTACLG